MLDGDDTDYDTLPPAPSQPRKPATRTYSKKAKQRATRCGPALVTVPVVAGTNRDDGTTTTSSEEETTPKGKGRVKKEVRARAGPDGRMMGQVGDGDGDGDGDWGHGTAVEKTREPEPNKQEVQSVKSAISTQAYQSLEKAGTGKTPVLEDDPRGPPSANTRATRLPRSNVQLERQIPDTSSRSSPSVHSTEQTPSSTASDAASDDPLVESARTLMRPRSKKFSALSDKSNLPKRSPAIDPKTKRSSEVPSLESMSLQGGQTPSEAAAARPNAARRTGPHSKFTKTRISDKRAATSSTLGIFHDPRPVDTDVKKDKNLHARTSRTSSKSKAQACAATVAPVPSTEASSALPVPRHTSSDTREIDGTWSSPHAVGTERSGYGQLPPPIVPIAAGTEDLSQSYHALEDDLSRHSSIVIETYEMTEHEVSESEEEGNETIRAAINLVILSPSAPGREVLDPEEPDRVAPAPVAVDDGLNGRTSSTEEANSSTETQTTEAPSSMTKPAPTIEEPKQLPESEFLTPGRALPPRHRQLSLAQPRPSGPGSDEDDLAYYLAITATGSSGEEDQDDRDRQEWLKGEAEIGKGVEPGWTMAQAQRRRYILRKLPVLGGEMDSDDELTLRGEVSTRNKE